MRRIGMRPYRPPRRANPNVFGPARHIRGWFLRQARLTEAPLMHRIASGFVESADLHRVRPIAPARLARAPPG
jgi:hypothetical protein